MTPHRASMRCGSGWLVRNQHAIEPSNCILELQPVLLQAFNLELQIRIGSDAERFDPSVQAAVFLPQFADSLDDIGGIEGLHTPSIHSCSQWRLQPWRRLSRAAILISKIPSGVLLTGLT